MVRLNEVFGAEGHSCLIAVIRLLAIRALEVESFDS